MSVKVNFTNGQVTEYPGGVEVSESPDGALKFVNDVAGLIIATIPAGDIKSTEIS
jgi:hypothetical protein